MSPTIIREGGFRVVIHTHDHLPPHVHVQKEGKDARVYLTPVALWDSDLTDRQTRQAVALVRENREILLAKWNEIHGKNEVDLE